MARIENGTGKIVDSQLERDYAGGMGNWSITIQGVGVHHNKKNPSDANRIAAAFVEKLKDAGHTVTSATITIGAAEDVQGGEEYLDDRDKIEK